MPYEIRELLPGLPKPVVAQPEEPLEDALARMLNHNYSQLPVVKGSGHSTQFYLLTTNNILSKLKWFGLPTNGKGLRVEHAIVKVPRVFLPTDTIAEIMDGLREMDAVLIVNEQQELQNIVTIYDTTHFFRQWSEDLLNAREVEMALRRIITGAFRRRDGEVDEEARQKVIDGTSSDDFDPSGKQGYKRFSDAIHFYLEQQARVDNKVDRRLAYQAFAVFTEGSEDRASGTKLDLQPQPSQDHNHTTGEASSSVASTTPVDVVKDLRRRFESALRHYLELANSTIPVNNDGIINSYRKYYQNQQEPRQFNKLTLGAYIDLFFSDQCWGRCGDVFEFEQEVVRRVLNDVRQVRNLMAHFREDEITEEHRRSLRLAADWLPQYERKALAKLDETAPPALENTDDLNSLLAPMPSE